MAENFQEFLKGQEAPTSVKEPPKAGSFSEFLAKQQTGEKTVSATETRKPFVEREGILQSIFAAPIGFGKDIAQFLPSRKKAKQSLEDLETITAEALNRTDLTSRSRSIIANIADEVPAYKDVLKAQTPEQMIGDILGTALLAVTPSQFIRGLGTGIAGMATRGAITGGTIGGASALSEPYSVFRLK